MQDWLDVLSGHHITFVGVYCDLAEAERRELQRGDRQIGQVLGQIGQVHLHGDYDISVDTTAKTPSQCADEVVQALKSGVGATAFDRLRRNSLGRRGSQNPSEKPASERTMT
jgi:chloramphenicol 3-O phosphotransferase